MSTWQRRDLSGLQYPQRPDKWKERTRNRMRQTFGCLPSHGNLAHCLPFPHLWEGMIQNMASAQQPWDEHHSQVVIPSHPRTLGETAYCSRENGVPGRGCLCTGLWVCAEGPRVVYVCRLEVKSDAVPRNHPPWDF